MKLPVTNPNLYFSVVENMVDCLYEKHNLDQRHYPLLTADLALMAERVEEILLAIATFDERLTFDPDQLAFFITRFQNCFIPHFPSNEDRVYGSTLTPLILIVQSFPPMKLYAGKGHAELWS